MNSRILEKMKYLPDMQLPPWTFPRALAIAKNVAESSRNAGRILQTPLGTFAIWKMWPTLWIRGAFLLYWDRGISVVHVYHQCPAGLMPSNLPVRVSSNLPVPVPSNLPVPVSSNIPVPVSSNLTVPVPSNLAVPVSSNSPGPVSSNLPVP